jgi:hypothetical protein
VNLLPAIHLPTKCTTFRINFGKSARFIRDKTQNEHTNPPQFVRPSKRLQSLEPIPGVQTQMILPESLPRREGAILLWNNYLSHRLPRILLGIPSYSNILDGLLIDILQELELQQVFGVVLGVEFLQLVAQDVVGVGVGLDRLFVQLPKRFHLRRCSSCLYKPQGVLGSLLDQTLLLSLAAIALDLGRCSFPASSTRGFTTFRLAKLSHGGPKEL